MGRGIQIYTRCRIIRGVLVQVHARDRYERFRGVFACMGPGDGPVRALGREDDPLLERCQPLHDDFQHLGGDGFLDGPVFVG